MLTHHANDDAERMVKGDAGESLGVHIYTGPVAVKGALLSAGDSHASQGDSELCGTAIECSLTGTFKLILHKLDSLTGTALAGLNYPLLETQDERFPPAHVGSDGLVADGHLNGRADQLALRRCRNVRLGAVSDRIGTRAVVLCGVPCSASAW